MLSTEQITDLINILARLNINVEQYMFCMILKDNRIHELYRYVNEISPFREEDLQDLEDKGYIAKFAKDSTTSDNFMVTDKFTSSIYNLDPSQPGEDLLDLYPSFVNVEGKRYPAKNVIKEDFLKEYYRKYGRYIGKHKEILELTKYGISKGLINMGLKKYIDSEFWESIKRDRKRRMSENEERQGNDPGAREI